MVLKRVVFAQAENLEVIRLQSFLEKDFQTAFIKMKNNSYERSGLIGNQFKPIRDFDFLILCVVQMVNRIL